MHQNDKKQIKMSDQKPEFSSVHQLLVAVNEFVTSNQQLCESDNHLKIEVYLGRGMYQFVLENKEEKLLREIQTLKSKLEVAEKEMITLKKRKIQ